MVKVTGPLSSFSAHGWLGRVTYGRLGIVKNPYPINFFQSRYGIFESSFGWGSAKVRWGATNFTWQGFRIPFAGKFMSFYYSKKGWCYQRRRTWHGVVWSAMLPPISEGTNTLERQVWRTAFKDAVRMWQGFDNETKDIYNKWKYPVHPSGYNRFIRYYLGEIRKEMPISPTVIIDHFDDQIHDGEAHIVSLISGEIAAAAVFYLLIKCHADYNLHCVMSFDSEGEWHREIFETPTITDDGAALTPRNRNRSSADGVNATFFSGPTIGADGTQLVERVMGSGKDEAGNGTTSEWILKKGLNYLMKMTNDAGANKHASMSIIFTEEAA